MITGGAGTLGTAFIRRALLEGWRSKLTVYSRDPVKHQKQKREWGAVTYVVGDICDYDSLVKTMAGQDIVIHAGAMKHIPECEANPVETMRVNYEGSLNVAKAASEARVLKVVGVSTDKACHPINIYGASKMAMERIFQGYAKLDDRVGYQSVRYGNVLGSTGSVLKVWREMLDRDGYVTATDPDMTRFWLTVDDAVDLILKSLDEPSGTITIPKCKALDMRTFAEYTMPSGTEFKYTGLRPGEKRYEELITKEESYFSEDIGDVFRLHQSTSKPIDTIDFKYTSNNCQRLTQSELLEMLK